MPNFEGPFTAEDLERIWLNNLTPTEQAKVICFFYDLSPVFFGINSALPSGLVRQSIEGIVGLLPGGGTATKIVSLIEGIGPTVSKSCARFRNSRLLVRTNRYTIDTFFRERRQ